MESVMNYIFLNKYFKTLLFLLNGVKLPFGYYKKKHTSSSAIRIYS